MPKEVSKLIEGQAHGDDFFLRNNVHEENCQEEEDFDEVSHTKGSDETLESIEEENVVKPYLVLVVIRPYFPRARKDDKGDQSR